METPPTSTTTTSYIFALISIPYIIRKVIIKVMQAIVHNILTNAYKILFRKKKTYKMFYQKLKNTEQKAERLLLFKYLGRRI